MRPGRKLMIQLILLAFLCVGGMELAVCRVYDPELYRTVTTPARVAAQAVAGWHRQTVSSATAVTAAAQRQLFELARRADALSQRIANRIALWRAPRLSMEELFPTEVQLAGEPALSSNRPQADPGVASMVQQGELELLVGSGLNTVYFHQGEEPWASQLFGMDPIGRYGCGPTVMAMAVSTLSDQAADPAEMAAWAAKNGYWCPGGGSYHTLIQGAAEAFGLSGQSMEDHSYQAIQDRLVAGDLVVALMGPGHFTTGGHFILLRGFTLSGELLVADPNSRERSLTPWDPEVLLSELSSSTSGGAPLWVISPHRTAP